MSAPAPPSPAALAEFRREGIFMRAVLLALVLCLHVLVLAQAFKRSPLTPAAAPSPPMLVSLIAPPEMRAAAQSPPPPATPTPRAIAKAVPAPPAPRRPPVAIAPAAPRAEPRPSPTASPPAPAEDTTPSIAAAGGGGGAQAAASAGGGIAPTAVAAAPLTPARYDAAYLNNQTPYPPLARRLGESGTVQLRVLISAEGWAEKVELLASSGSPRLDEGAQAAVRHWRFVPARRGDQPVASYHVIPIIYTLKEP